MGTYDLDDESTYNLLRGLRRLRRLRGLLSTVRIGA